MYGKDRKPKGKKLILKDSFSNEVLLRIRRDHPESAGIRLLEIELEKVRIENGQNLSLIQELQHTLSQIEKMTEDELASWKLVKKQDLYLVQLNERIKKAEKDSKDWQRKYFDLLLETQKNILPQTTTSQ